MCLTVHNGGLRAHALTVRNGGLRHSLTLRNGGFRGCALGRVPLGKTMANSP